MSLDHINSKKIRKSFGKIPLVTSLPNLIEVQKRSFDNFLQLKTKPESLKDSGLHAVFKSVFPINDYTERAIVRSTRILFNENKLKKAVPLWEKLEKIASYPENKRYAQFNLMRTYFNWSEFDKAIAKADIVLSYDNLEPKVMWDARYFLAKSYLGKKDTLSAKNIFLIIEDSPIDSLAAEAHYFRAQWKHKDKAYSESNEIISIISEKFNDQPLWAAKSLFLMAKNFHMQNDIFQATYILESLLDNFVQFPMILSEAKKYLLMIEKNKTKKNDVDGKN